MKKDSQVEVKTTQLHGTCRYDTNNQMLIDNTDDILLSPASGGTSAWNCAPILIFLHNIQCISTLKYRIYETSRCQCYLLFLTSLISTCTVNKEKCSQTTRRYKSSSSTRKYKNIRDPVQDNSDQTLFPMKSDKTTCAVNIVGCSSSIPNYRYFDIQIASAITKTASLYTIELSCN